MVGREVGRSGGREVQQRGGTPGTENGRARRSGGERVCVIYSCRGIDKRLRGGKDNFLEAPILCTPYMCARRGTQPSHSAESNPGPQHCSIYSNRALPPWPAGLERVTRNDGLGPRQCPPHLIGNSGDLSRRPLERPGLPQVRRLDPVYSLQATHESRRLSRSGDGIRTN